MFPRTTETRHNCPLSTLKGHTTVLTFLVRPLIAEMERESDILQEQVDLKWRLKNLNLLQVNQWKIYFLSWRIKISGSHHWLLKAHFLLCTHLLFPPFLDHLLRERDWLKEKWKACWPHCNCLADDSWTTVCNMRKEEKGKFSSLRHQIMYLHKLPCHNWTPLFCRPHTSSLHRVKHSPLPTCASCLWEVGFSATLSCLVAEPDTHWSVKFGGRKLFYVMSRTWL